MTKEQLKDYAPGMECRCGARASRDCGCNVDWTPREVYALRAANSHLRSALYQITEETKDYNILGIASAALKESALDKNYT